VRESLWSRVLWLFLLFFHPLISALNPQRRPPLFFGCPQYRSMMYVLSSFFEPHCPNNRQGFFVPAPFVRCLFLSNFSFFPSCAAFSTLRMTGVFAGSYLPPFPSNFLSSFFATRGDPPPPPPLSFYTSASDAVVRFQELVEFDAKMRDVMPFSQLALCPCREQLRSFDSPPLPRDFLGDS